MGKLLDFRVVVLDSRADILTASRFPDADELVVGHPTETASLVRLDERTHVVIVTHGHLHDKDALRAVVASPAPYIGMIGSRAKVRTVFDELVDEGVSPEALARVHSPVGLDLGGQTPGEISLAILAEIVALRHGRGRDVRPRRRRAWGRRCVAGRRCHGHRPVRGAGRPRFGRPGAATGRWRWSKAPAISPPESVCGCIARASTSS